MAGAQNSVSSDTREGSASCHNAVGGRDSGFRAQSAACSNNDNNDNASASSINGGNSAARATNARPLILITDSSSSSRQFSASGREGLQSGREASGFDFNGGRQWEDGEEEREEEEEEEQVEEVDGISYRIVAAVTKPAERASGSGASRQASEQRDLASMEAANKANRPPSANNNNNSNDDDDVYKQNEQRPVVRANNDTAAGFRGGIQAKLSSVRRRSSTFVSNLLHSNTLHQDPKTDHTQARTRRLSIYEMTKSPPPETSLEIYLSERRRSSTISSKHVQQQLEQQSTFQTNYCQRQQYFKDLNQKLINHDRKLLNVVANRGQIHRHSVDIAQLPLNLAQAKASKASADRKATAETAGIGLKSGVIDERDKSNQLATAINQFEQKQAAISQQEAGEDPLGQTERLRRLHQPASSGRQVLAPSGLQEQRVRTLMVAPERKGSSASKGRRKSRLIIRRFQKLEHSLLSSTPAPDVKIGQRVAYKEYYGSEFGTIRWIGRVPQICPDWTAGVEFDNAIGEGDGSLNGRRYFIAKDCFAKFLPLSDIAFVDQHVGRPEPGTMISVMSAAVRPGQMISIQRVSTVHVQHCFLNAPHRRPLGAEILAVNTRLHCQCPNCGPCAHVIKPPRTQRLARAGKNATHMCQFSTYTCCGMESQEEAMCTYTGNKISSLPPPPLHGHSSAPLPPVGHSWIEGAGYLTKLQAQQSKLMPEEYKLGAAPEDINSRSLRRRQLSRPSSMRRGSGKHNHHHHHHQNHRRHHHRHRHRQQHLDQQSSMGTQLSDFKTDLTIAGQPGSQPAEQSVNSDCQALECFIGEHANQEPATRVSNAPDSSQLAVACRDKVLANETDWHTSGASEVVKDLPKSPKVVYRDSIENRYLFPTDDLIDSALEADLETLSQARYGRCNNQRLGASRNILKSLRSLVSCLSVQSNRSELERHSENTLRFSGYPTKATNESVPMTEDVGEAYRGKSSSGDHKNLTNIMPNRAVKRQVSSSSDCGISSASLNSMNIPTNTCCSPVLSAEEGANTYQIYRQIVANLLTSASANSEDRSRLKSILLESKTDEGCLSCKNQNEPHSKTDFDSKLSAEEGCNCYCSFQERIHDYQYRSDPIITEPVYRGRNNGSTSGSATLSSFDSICGTDSSGHIKSSHSHSGGNNIGKGKDQIKTDDKVANEAALLKGFELKLTLSINSDKREFQTLNQEMNVPVAEVTNVKGKNASSNGLLNPVFNINIISAREDGQPEISSKESLFGIDEEKNRFSNEPPTA